MKSQRQKRESLSIIWMTFTCWESCRILCDLLPIVFIFAYYAFTFNWKRVTRDGPEKKLAINSQKIEISRRD